MKGKFSLLIILLISILIWLFVIYKRSSNELIGKLPVQGISNVYFKIYQQNEFDSAIPIEYEIVDSTDNIISERHHLTGTRDNIKNLNMFNTGSYDSIIYLTVWDSNEVYAIFDLKSGLGYPRGKSLSEDYKSIRIRGDSLMKILNSYDEELFRHGTKPY